jgi:hypothetical protein
MSGGQDKNSPDWLGLLQWSLAHQDGTAPTNISMMTQENQAWLERVMREGIVDEPAKIGEAILAIKQHMEGDCLSDTDVELFEDIADITEQIDMAGVFVKLGGLKLIHSLVSRYSAITESVLLAALALVGAVAQNHPEVQDNAVTAVTTATGNSESLLDAIVRILRGPDTISVPLQTKAMLAISCIVRGNRTGESVLITRYYLDLFGRLLAHHGYVKVSPEVDTPLTVNTAATALIGRLFFVSRALLSSEFLSRQRIQIIANTMLPACSIGIESSDVNIRDNCIGLVSELLCTADGRELLSTFQDGILSSVDTAISQLRDALLNSTCDDDKQYIRGDINTLTTFCNTLRQAQTSNSAGLRAVVCDSEGNGSDAVLMLGSA